MNGWIYVSIDFAWGASWRSGYFFASMDIFTLVISLDLLYIEYIPLLLLLPGGG